MNKEDIKQIYHKPPQFDAYPKDSVIQEALGSRDVLSRLERGNWQSVNFIPSVQGWRFTPRSLDINSFTFAPGSIALTALANIASGTVLGNASGSTGPVTALTASGGINIGGGKINVSMARHFLLMGS